VQSALATLPGVRQVEVDFTNKVAVVKVDNDKVDIVAMTAALKKAGFGGSVAKPNNEKNSDSNGETSPAKGDTQSSAATKYVPDRFGQYIQVAAKLDYDVVIPGRPFRVAVVFDVARKWHIYGNPLGPGIGQPTVISASGPNGFQFAPTRYAPAKKQVQDLGDEKTWVFEHHGQVVHYLLGKVASDVAPGDYLLTLTAAGQVCDENACIPGKAIVELKVRVASVSTKQVTINQELFSKFNVASVPVPTE
jgi:hypothetical protein